MTDPFMLGELRQSCRAALEKLCKWRLAYAGRWLGTRPKSDPACASVRDFTDARLLLRAEVSALVGLLLKKGLLTEVEWLTAIKEEAEQLDRDQEQVFPGYRSTPVGLEIYDVAAAKETMKSWPL
jgi:hypothetical protein